jgi:two-component system NtrC family sensor kinase
MKDVEVIEKESARARGIVQQLLEFARRRTIELMEVDINSLISEAVSLIGVQLRDERISIREDFSPLPLIKGDPNQLKQVLLNIINNAVHALAGIDGYDGVTGRQKEIQIRTGKNEASVYVEIADNGHGISSDVLPKIFEPFFTTKREKGTGLGLSITYKIIQSHKGRIDVKSEKGKGAKFTITLPTYISESLYSRTIG